MAIVRQKIDSIDAWNDRDAVAAILLENEQGSRLERFFVEASGLQRRSVVLFVGQELKSFLSITPAEVVEQAAWDVIEQVWHILHTKADKAIKKTQEPPNGT